LREQAPAANQVYGPDGRVKRTIEGLALRGRSVFNAPGAGNLAGKTVVLVQYDQASGSDGHFVAFEVEAALAQWEQFFSTETVTGRATLATP
jgi:hypothetical protein